MLIGIFTAVLIAVFGLLIKHFKCDWLIAGYNTMPEHKKRNVDIDGLRRFIGNSLLLMSVILLQMFYSNHTGRFSLFVILIVVFTGHVFYTVIKAQSFDKNPKTKTEKWVLFLAMGVVALTLIGSLGMVLYGARAPEILATREYLEIEGMYGVRQPMKDIAEVALKDSIPQITRKINGYDAGSIKKGAFHLEGLGSGTLFLQSSDGPFIYVTTNDSFIIINFRDSGKTQELYNNIQNNR